MCQGMINTNQGQCYLGEEGSVKGIQEVLAIFVKCFHS